MGSTERLPYFHWSSMKMNAATAILVILCFIVGCQKQQKEAVSEEKELGYVIGVDIGKRLKNQPFPVDIHALIQGVEDSYLDRPLLYSEDSIISLALKFQKRGDAYESTMQSNREMSLKFQEANSTVKGVTSLSNGLQYKILSGTQSSIRPTRTSWVKCHLRGYLLDGEILEDTYSAGEARVFEVRRAISGIQESLKLMSPGMKIIAWIPSQLAYGRDKVRGKIPEYSLLIYEIELLEIKK
jgi:FKBP-type peptidyl-prolyl cis-trans isomerase